MIKILIIFLNVFLYGIIDGYKILVYSPIHSRSHMISNRRLADELAIAGHNVTLLEVELVLKSTDLKSAKHAKILSLGGFDPKLLADAVGDLTVNSFDENPSLIESYRAYLNWMHVYNKLCDDLLLMHNETLEKLKEEKFDIIFSEMLNLCGAGLKEVLGVKTHIWVSSCPMMNHVAWVLGTPTPLSYVPTVGDVDLSDKPSYLERFWNIIDFVGSTYIYYLNNKETTEIFRNHYGPNFPDVEQIALDSPITFVAADEILDFPRPILHNTIYIGGLGVKNNAKALKESYKSEMEKGKKGVVFFSLGSQTNTNKMPLSVRENLFKVFGLLTDYHFIVKINEGDTESETFAKKLPNVFLIHWAPQPDILAHPRVKAFVTHGGYNSLNEAARAGVPLVTLPFFVDQWRNGRVAERNGWGISFDKRLLKRGSEKFYSALRKILEDPSYQEKAKRTQKLVATKPFSAAEKFLRYTEFVAENEGILPELQIEGRNLDFFAYYNFDIFVPILGILSFLIYIFVKIFIFLITFLFLRTKVQSVKIKKQ